LRVGTMTLTTAWSSETVTRELLVSWLVKVPPGRYLRVT